jgi:imidazolonepropionase-like amidohydrolase
MHLRVVLRTPGGDTVTRDTRDGVWVDPWGTPDETTPADCWAVPGLVDAHAHLARDQMDFAPGDLPGAERRAALALDAGVGLIYDKGWRDLTVVRLIDELAGTERPEIEAAGAIYAVEGGYWEGFARNIEPGAIESAVAEAAAEGRGWVKLVGDWPRKGEGPRPNFSEDELARAVAVAEAHDSKVAIHTMAREVPSMAVRAGVHSIEHGLFLSPEDLETLGARAGIWVPTVLQVEAVVRQLGAESSGGRLLAEGLEKVIANLAHAVECGVNVLTGTDLAVGAHQVALEAIRLWELGMAPGAVLDAVAGAGFRVSGHSSGFDVGVPANVVLFAEDPLLDPRVLARPRHVIRLGRLLR